MENDDVSFLRCRFNYIIFDHAIFLRLIPVRNSHGDPVTNRDD